MVSDLATKQIVKFKQNKEYFSF